MLCRTYARVLLLAMMCGTALPALASAEVKGVVRDTTGAVVAGAEVTLKAGSFHAKQRTSPEGQFVFEQVPAQAGTLRAEAPGFAPHEEPWKAHLAFLAIVLRPLAAAEQVTVSARVPSRIEDTAGSVSTLERQDVQVSGAVTLDEILRQVPGFTLFRRSGSVAANPTTQGASLRGVGGSGAGRALVLYDGIPLNDPFGGWVYWDRVPEIAVGEVEVLRGGASDLYGTGALAGVVTVSPREPQTSMLDVQSYVGNHATPEGSALGNLQLGRTALKASGEAFRTDGYYILRPEDRGLADTPADLAYRTGRVELSRDIGSGRVFAAGSLFGEERNNGTALQVNHTRLGQVAAGGNWGSTGAGAFNLRLYAEGARYYQTFTAVTDDRSSELLVRTQRVPAQRLGLSFFWTKAIARHTLVAGTEAQEIRGHSDEFVYSSGVPFLNQDNGGRQRMVGVFGEDIMRLGAKWVVTAGGRVDRWRNFDALSASTPLATGITTVKPLPETTQTAFSPRLSVLRKINGTLSLAAAAYRSFRAPTLNELYRPFRVGQALTLANPTLEAERLTGAEGSAIVRAGRNVALRGTFFWNEVTNPVANVTLSVTPQLITRQRQNLGSTEARGVELQATAQVTDSVQVSGGYEFAHATVLSFAADPALVGNWVPQVARQQFTVQARYLRPRLLTLAVQGRYVGRQYDDDQNRFALDPFFTVDAYVAHPLARQVELFAAAQNLFNERYIVGRTPLITVGPPLLARVGVRLTFSAR